MLKRKIAQAKHLMVVPW